MKGFLKHTSRLGLLFGLAALAPDIAAAQETQARDTTAPGAVQDTGQAQNPPGYRGMERTTDSFPADSGSADSAWRGDSLGSDTTSADSTRVDSLKYDSVGTDRTRVGETRPRVPAEPTGQPPAPGAGTTGP
jgi:hypothetical protein